MKIKYRQGALNANADALSRAPIARCNVVTVRLTPDAFKANLRDGYPTDPEFKEILEGISCEPPSPQFDRFRLNEDGLIVYMQPGNEYARICIPTVKEPTNWRMMITHDHHDAHLGAHLGTAKTLNRVARHCYWFGHTKDIKDYVRSCNPCQLNKPSNKTYGPHQPLPAPPRRWHTVTTDFAGPFVSSGEGGWDMIMIVVDKFTKRTHFIPAKQKDTAPDTARRFFDHIVRLHGMPEIIVSDRDAKLTSLFWTTLCTRFGTKLAMSTAYHPQTDGQTERMVRTLKEMLRSAVNHRQTDWVEHLPPIEFAYNNSLHPSTGLTPFENDLGYHPRAPYSNLLADQPQVKSVDDFIDGLEVMQHRTIEYLEHAGLLQSRQFNKGRLRPKALEVGQLVLLSTQYVQPAFMRTTGAKKLRAKYIGPFAIDKRISPTSYSLDLPAGIKVHPVVDIEYLKGYHVSPERLGPRTKAAQMTWAKELVNEREIESVKDHRETRSGALQYLVHWKDTAEHDDTWEPVSSIDHRLDLIQQYWGSRNMQDELSNMRKKVKEPKKPRKPRTATGQERTPVAGDNTPVVETSVTHVGDHASATNVNIADITANNTK
ncbi:hypothetical protein NCC49_002838 [Naganishia albida]|nr:hypothetical protein NCC49_002838 [Naganishia albida]